MEPLNGAEYLAPKMWPNSRIFLSFIFSQAKTIVIFVAWRYFGCVLLLVFQISFSKYQYLPASLLFDLVIYTAQ